MSDYQTSVEFLSCYSELIEAARRRGTTNYTSVARILGIHKPGSHMAMATGKVLGMVTDLESEAGRPMLSAVCIASEGGLPGPGFFALAKKLGRFTGDVDSRDEKKAFWQEEIEAVYAVWKTSELE